MELLSYVIRPDNTALWLPEELMILIGAKYGQKISAEQFGHHSIQRLIADRSVKKEAKEK